MGEKRKAIATLLYSADYLPGVFTLGYQLKKLKEEEASKTSLLLLVSRDLYQGVLSEFSIGVLRKLFNNIIVVDPVKGSIAGNNENLKLLQRPELYFTLVKARLWELDYDEVLYLDGDTLPLSSDIFKLFDDYPIKKNEIGGVPDVGWPDMFNSGVLLLSPDMNLAHALQQFIANNISMDGADQGILNQFFNAHCSKSEGGKQSQKWVRIPFIYNVTMPNYGYQNSPAIKFFKQQCKLIHFIGEKKPWRDWCADDRGNGYYSSQWNKVYLEFQAEHSLSQDMSDLKLGPILSARKEASNQSDKPQNMSDLKSGPILPAEKESPIQSDKSQVMSDLKLEPILPAEKESPTQSDKSQVVSDLKLEPILPAEKESPTQSDSSQVVSDLKLEPILPARKEAPAQLDRSHGMDELKLGSGLPAWKESLIQSEQEPERIFPEVLPQQPVSDISTPPVAATLQFKSAVSTPPPSTKKKEASRPPNVERVFPEDYESLDRA